MKRPVSLATCLLVAVTSLQIAFSSSGCAPQEKPEEFNLRAYLEKQEGFQVHAAETLRSLEEEQNLDPDMRAKLGVYYLLGYGAIQDDSKGRSIIKEAADAGSSRAQLIYGVTLMQGLGVPKDEPAAFKYLLLASKGVGQDAQKGREFAADLTNRLSKEQVETISREADVKPLMLK